MGNPLWQKLKPGVHYRRVRCGDDLGFDLRIWRGAKPGPTLLLNGGTHGDEYEGPVLLTEMANTWRPADLRGTVVAVPVLNEGAYFAGRRTNPADGKDLARVFPGDANGSPTERVAHAFHTECIAHADYYCDFHSAGTAYEILPWVGYIMVDDPDVMESQRLMARAFRRNMWCWGSTYLPGRTISSAHQFGVPSIYTESQGKGTADAGDLRDLRDGINRLLRALKMMPGGIKLQPHDVVRESTAKNEGYLQGDHPAPCDGTLLSIVEIGSLVKAGDVIAVVQPLQGRATRTIVSKTAGRAVFVRRQRSVRKGDALASVISIP